MTLTSRFLFCFIFCLLALASLANDDVKALQDLLDKTLAGQEDTALMREIAAVNLQNPEEILQFFNDAEIQLSDPEQRTLRAKILNAKGNVMLQLGRFDEGVAAHQKSMALKLELGDKKQIASSYLNLGAAHALTENFEAALDNFRKGLSTYQAIDNAQGIVDAYLSLGTFYLRNRNDKIKAEAYFLKAYKIYEAEDLTADNGVLFYNLTILYVIKKDIAQAKFFSQRAKEMYLREGDFFGLGMYYNTVGIIFSEQGDPENALLNFELAQEVFDEENNKEYAAETRVSMAKQYRSLGDFHSAARFDSIALAMHQELEHHNRIAESFLALVADLKGIGNFEGALEMLENHKALSDSLLENNNTTLQELLAKFEAENKEQRILALENEAAISAQKTVILTVSLAFVLLLAVFLISRQSIIRRKEKDLFEADERAKKLELSKVRKEIEDFTKRISQKNTLIAELQAKAALPGDPKGYANKEELAALRILTESDWDEFKDTFEKSHPSFLKQLKSRFPQLTVGEQRLFMLIKLELTTSQISDILGISKEGVRKTRYRLRKKLELDLETDLEAFVGSFLAQSQQEKS